jgi:colanic acid biosynthesis glycosyl transferase WcaI
MRILLISRYFPPEVGTAANLFYELAKGLSRRGHQVTVATSFPWYNLQEIPKQYRGRLRLEESVDGFKVRRLAFPVPGPVKMKLAVGHLTSPLASILAGVGDCSPDLIYAYSPPLPMGLSGWVLQIIKKAPFMMGVQDLHPQCYIDQGVLKNRFMIRVLEGLEKFCYRAALAITVHSEGNKLHIVEKKGIAEKKVKVLPNWIDTDELGPLPRENHFSEEHGLNDKFVVGYAGTLGMSQGLMSVVEAAALLRDRKNVDFFIVGDGIEKAPMLTRVKDLGLQNIRFLPMQPKAIYPWVVASCDVGLVTLNAKVKTPVVPSKILSLMAAGRPVLASLPLDGDAPKLIQKAGCGICVGPENPEMLAKEILRLSENSKLCQDFGRRGRSYVTKEMSLGKAVQELEALFDQVIHEYRNGGRHK